jgi:hypothetical protein
MYFSLDNESLIEKSTWVLNMVSNRTLKILIYLMFSLLL